MLRVGIIGAGRMGRIRALAAKGHSSCRVTWVSDTVAERALALASEVDAQVGADWRSVIFSEDVDAVVVATTHKHLPELTIRAIQAQKHVFCEKPVARHFLEAESILRALQEQAAKGSSSFVPTVVVGYTLRHHPAVQKAWEIVASGEIGHLLYVRGRYGHGGRPGYGDEWRTSPEESGGGELLDQGVHLIDLSRCFLGNFTKTTGSARCFHWAKGRSEVEDNAFMLLETADEKVAFLHASWTQWKNLFSFEIFGDRGAVIIEGLGGSYGVETLRVMKRQLKGGPPEISEFQFPFCIRDGLEEIWMLEWEAFVKAVGATKDQTSKRDLPPATPEDACGVLATVDSLYQYQCTGSEVASAP